MTLKGKICLATVLLTAFLTPSVHGVFFDMSKGDPGMEFPCPIVPFVGNWTEEEASLYQTPESGPLDGFVLTSEFQTRSCLRSPDFFTVDQNFTLKLYVYMPKADVEIATRKIQVWLVQGDGYYIVYEERGPSEGGWFLIESPVPSTPGIIYPFLYKVDIWVTEEVDFAAIRWFGLSDGPLPPDEFTTTNDPFTTDLTTTEEPTTPPYSDQGVYFDMSGGDPGMTTPCPPGLPLVGKWTEQNASIYETLESGPLEGLVLTSEFQTRSCLATPDFFVVQQNFTFQLSVYFPEAADIGNKTRKLQVWLVEEDEWSYIIYEERGPSEAGWFLIESPMPMEPELIYPSLCKVEIWVTQDVDFAAIRWFGLSDGPLPPPDFSTTTAPSIEY